MPARHLFTRELVRHARLPFILSVTSGQSHTPWQLIESSQAQLIRLVKEDALDFVVAIIKYFFLVKLQRDSSSPEILSVLEKFCEAWRVPLQSV